MQATELMRVVAHGRKAEIEELAGRKMSEAEAESIVGVIVGMFFDAVTDSLRKGVGVALRRFGKFEQRHRRATTIRNPITGAWLDVPARTTVGFTPAEGLKAAVRNKEHDDESGNVHQQPPAG